MSIREVDTRTAPESLLREMHEVYLEWDLEIFPDDPPDPLGHRLAEWRFVPEHQDVRHWILRDHGAIAAVAMVRLRKHEDLNNAFGWIFVREESRRRGFATQLSRPLLQTMMEANRGSIITDVLDGEPWESKLGELGLKKAYQERLSRLLVSEVDWSLMDSWIRRAGERAGEYDLLFLRTPIDDRYLDRWCGLMDVMNTAPREDLEFEDSRMTPEKWREIERIDLLRGQPLMAYVAVHRPTGEFTGISEIVALDHHPTVAYQGDTGVDPAHRNKGLGRWLKAAMIMRFVAERPQVERLFTGNADSNESMLNINVAMGYHPATFINAWQGEVATVRDRLGF